MYGRNGLINFALFCSKGKFACCCMVDNHLSLFVHALMLYLRNNIIQISRNNDMCKDEILLSGAVYHVQCEAVYYSVHWFTP